MSAAGDATPSRPNLLYIHSDQHNPAVLGCYGDELVQTPHLDGLAAKGVVCSAVYCPSPVCVPSRMAMLCGKYPHEIEVWTNGQILGSEVPTLAHAMGAAGYRPLLAGRMHSVGPDQLHGYVDRPIGDHGGNWPGSGAAPRQFGNRLAESGAGQSLYQVHDEDVTATAVSFLKQQGESRRAGADDGPFSLSVGFMLPHHPYLARRALYDRYRDIMTLPAVREPFGEQLHPFVRWWREWSAFIDIPEETILDARAAYWALVEEMDSMIGQILTALEENGLAGNTLILYTSDHGDSVGEHDLWMKRTFYEESVKVPAILSWPGVLPEGTRCDRVMSSLDLNATMLAAMQAPELPGSRGRDALSLLGGADDSWEGVAFSEYALQEGPVQRMIRKQEWKLVYHHNERPQLFDVAADPHETVDRAEDPDCRDVVEELLHLVLHNWDPEWVARRVQERRADAEVIGQWAKTTQAPDLFRWERRN